MRSSAALQARALAELAGAHNLAALESWRVDVLGGRGALRELQRGLAGLPPADRPAVGQAFNEAKQALEAAFARASPSSDQQRPRQELVAQRVDVTLPGRPPASGAPPDHADRRAITDFFASMGFQVAEGPEVERTTTTSRR